MTIKEIKTIINHIFRRQYIISCGKIRTIVSNGEGKYTYYNTNDILDNRDTGNFYPYNIKQR